MGTCTETSGSAAQKGGLDTSLGSLGWLTALSKATNNNEAAPTRTLADHTQRQQRSPSNVNDTDTMTDADGGEDDDTSEIQNIDEDVGVGSPSVDASVKPNLSYAELIKLAVNSTPLKRMTLNEIYGWIMSKYPYYCNQDRNQSWKNSIRHNLSLNRHFVRESRDRSDPGKGSYWRYCDNPVVINVQTDSTGVRYGRIASHDTGKTYEVPRVNPVIQRMYGVAPPPPLVVNMDSTTAVSSAHSPLTPFSVGQVSADTPVSLVMSPEGDPEGPMLVEQDFFAQSHNSACSQESFQSNFKPFPELTESIDLSASTRDLFNSVVNSSMRLPTEPCCSTTGVGSVGAAVSSQTPLDVSMGGSFSLPPHLGSPLGFNNTNLGLSSGSGTFDVGSPPVLQAQNTTAAAPAVSSNNQLSILVASGDTSQYAGFRELAVAGTSTQGQNISNLWSSPNIASDLDQFRSMMGSWQGKDIQEWLTQCSNPLAMSWRGFLNKSIGAGMNANRSEQSSQAALQNEPPINWGCNISDEQRMSLLQQFLASTQPAFAFQGNNVGGSTAMDCSPCASIAYHSPSLSDDVAVRGSGGGGAHQQLSPHAMSAPPQSCGHTNNGGAAFGAVGGHTHEQAATTPPATTTTTPHRGGRCQQGGNPVLAAFRQSSSSNDEDEATMTTTMAYDEMPPQFDSAPTRGNVAAADDEIQDDFDWESLID